MVSILELVLSTLLLVPLVSAEAEIVVGYYAESGASFLSPANIPFSKLTHVIYGMNLKNEKNI